MNNPHDFQGSILLLIDLFNEVSVVVYIHAYVYTYVRISLVPDPTAYIGAGERVVFVAPVGMLADPVRLLFVLLHNPLYDIRTGLKCLYVMLVVSMVI